jgi:hypothetical protein
MGTFTNSLIFHSVEVLHIKLTSDIRSKTQGNTQFNIYFKMSSHTVNIAVMKVWDLNEAAAL